MTGKNPFLFLNYTNYGGRGHYAERHFAERHFAERHFAERHFDERLFYTMVGNYTVEK
jgi:hypothetical protein